MPGLGLYIIGLMIALVLFLILRAVNLWYWRIDERINLMQEQNDLLRKLIEINTATHETVSPGKISSNQIINESEASSVTVKNKQNRNVQTVSIEYWNRMKKEYGEVNFEIISFNK